MRAKGLVTAWSLRFFEASAQSLQSTAIQSASSVANGRQLEK